MSQGNRDKQTNATYTMRISHTCLDANLVGLAKMTHILSEKNQSELRDQQTGKYVCACGWLCKLTNRQSICVPEDVGLMVPGISESAIPRHRQRQHQKSSYYCFFLFDVQNIAICYCFSID